jgi:hypothetical protein
VAIGEQVDVVSVGDEQGADETVIYIVLSVAMFALFAFHEWRFRTGWRMSKRPSRAELTRDLYITLLYTALPNMYLTACAAILLTMTKLLGTEGHGVLMKAIVVFLFLALVGSGIWAAKEFRKPTERRTPSWLRADPWFRDSFGQ